MKFTTEDLALAAEHVGFEYNEELDRVYYPADDYYESGAYTGGVNVILKDVSEFGRSFGSGVYCKPEQLDDVARALAGAERDMFPNVYLFVDRKPKLTLVK